MKSFGKKTLAVLLTIAMAMSMCCVSAFAADDNTTGDVPIGPLPDTSVVTGLTASASTTSLTVGQTATITASVEPAEADQTVSCIRTAGDAVTVSGTTVTAVKAGTATVMVYSNDLKADGTPATTSINFTVTAAEEIKIRSAGPVAGITVPYGFTASDLSAMLNVIDVPVTYTNNATSTVKTTWTAVSGTSLGTAVGSTCIYRANITNTVTGFVQPTVTVTVGKATIVGYTAIPDIEVPIGTAGETVAAKFPKSFKVKLQDNSERTLTVGTDMTLAGSYDATSTTAATYAFTASLKDTIAANYTVANGVNFGFNVKTVTSWKLSDISAAGVIEGDEDVIDTDLDNEVYYAIRAVLGKAPGSFSFANFSDLDYGSVSKTTGNYTVSLDSEEEEELYEKGSLSDKFSYSLTVGGVLYTGDVYLTMYTTDIYENFGKTSGSLSAVASAISTRLKAMYGNSYGLEDIYFSDMDLEGGDLYSDSGFDEVVFDDESYTASELSAMYYVPNGTGEYSAIDYVAYGDEDGDYDISGTIYLLSDEFMIIQAQITTEETLNFSSSEFEHAFLDLDSDYYELTTVAFTSGVPYSADDGYIYYDGETKIKSGTTKYYVEPEKSSDKAIDDLHFEPGKKGGVHSISFTAVGYDDDDKKVTVTGIYQITVTEVADITISAGKGLTVDIDPDLFQEFLEDYDTSNKDLEIVSVTIYGAPYQAKKGYLVTDGEELNKSGDKTFYVDDDDVDVSKKKYDLYDLSFKGGSTDTTTNATFKITYLRSGSSTKRNAEGTIDFVVGSSDSINNAQNPMKASQVLSFVSELSTFASLGDNDNVYVVFTSLPRGGKLYYNYGLPTQTDVTIGTEYYIIATSGKQLLRNVTFVPSYSSDKIAKTISWDVKGYNKNGKAVTGTVDISVIYAYTSLYFPDIISSLYADSVDFLYNRGITKGVPGGKYDANGQLSRAELVTFLYRAAGEPAVSGTSKFTDVPTTEYFYKAVLWATQNGITKGTNAAGTLFSPYAKVTNQEIIQFMYNYDVIYLKHTSFVSGSSSFVYDYNQVADWAQVAVKWAVGKNVLTPGLLNPTTVGIRGNIALYLHRMLTL